jgi:hypothetical protein
MRSLSGRSMEVRTKLSPLKTDLTFPWLTAMLMYRAGGTFGMRDFPSGGMRGLGKGSGMLASSPLEVRDALDAFESERLCGRRTAWPILISRGMSAIDNCRSNVWYFGVMHENYVG